MMLFGRMSNCEYFPSWQTKLDKFFMAGHKK